MRRKQMIRFLGILFCFYLIITTVQAIVDMSKAEDKLTSREKRLEALKKQKEELLARKAATSRPDFWEKIARNELGMVKPGEEVIVIPQELLADPPPIATPPAIPNWKRWLWLLF